MSGSVGVQGYDLVNGKKLLAPYSRTIVCRAAGAVTVGWPVGINGSTPFGIYAKALTVGNDHQIAGVYNGVGGSLTVVTNITNHNGGRAATTDDQIEVVVEGPVFVRAAMGATNTSTLNAANQGTVMGYSVTDGVFQSAALTGPPVGCVAKFCLLGTGTVTDGTTTEASAVAIYINP